MRVETKQTTEIDAPPDEVWRHVTHMPSVNEEMGPFLRMTYPPEGGDLSLDDLPIKLGEPIFSSWVLAFGLLPIARMKVTLVELERGHRFVEGSPMSGVRDWRHERTVEPSGEGRSKVTDHVSFEAPIARLAPLLSRVLGAFFAHRHRKLAARFMTSAHRGR